MKKNVGILVFEGVEVLDFAGPYEVFGVSSNLNNDQLFHVFNVAKSLEPVHARNQFSVNPTYSFADHPQIDILILPGGSATRQLIQDQETLNWVSKVHSTAQITMSVCTGSLLLGKLGLLNNLPYCTHQDGYPIMKELTPSGIPLQDHRYVESLKNRIYTSGGIAAGIDLSLFILGQLHGEDVVKMTTIEMEYSPNQANYNIWAHI